MRYLDDTLGIPDFYCVKNETTKEDETDDFERYRELHDSSQKAFYLFGGCKRKWLNESDETRGRAGINVYWPDLGDKHFAAALVQARNRGSPNNISPIITYGVEDSATVMWMGDLDPEFMESIQKKLKYPRAHILFAPHHGRGTGKVPETLLEAIAPKIVVVGEAPSAHLNYHAGYNTITQNSAGNIVFQCADRKVHVYVSENDYSVDFLDDEGMAALENYLGTLNL